MILRKISGGLNNSSGRLKSSETISNKQIKAIWALANRLGFLEEELHARIKSMTGKKSIRLLNRLEARKVISDLLLMAEEVDKESIEEDGRGTRAQMAFIQALTRQLGWNEKQVLGLAEKMFGVHRLKDLNVKQASGLIEALKAIKDRHAA